MTNFETAKLLVLDRLKAITAVLGGLLNLLYQVQAVHPDARVTALIALLTALGVHQVPNL